MLTWWIMLVMLNLMMVFRSLFMLMILWHDNHVVGCWCEWYMLNVDCWLWIYTYLMLIIGCGNCMYRIMLLNSYMQFDDDNCGACIYERCLFLVMIIWWMIGDKHVYVMLFVEHVKCWLLVMNSYMLILMVILLVNACMQNEGDIGYYIQWWWVVVVNMCIM